MAKKALSVPAVIINNKTLAIVPGSLVYEDGHPEINVRALSSGGGKGESVHTINAENAVSMVKFKLALTDDLDELGVLEYAASFFDRTGGLLDRLQIEADMQARIFFSVEALYASAVVVKGIVYQLVECQFAIVYRGVHSGFLILM